MPPNLVVGRIDVAIIVEVGREDRLVHHLQLHERRQVVHMKRQSRGHARNIDVIKRSRHAAGRRNDVKRVAQRRHEGAVDIDVQTPIQLGHAGNGESIKLVEQRAGELKLDQAGIGLLIVVHRLAARPY